MSAAGGDWNKYEDLAGVNRPTKGLSGLTGFVPVAVRHGLAEGAVAGTQQGQRGDNSKKPCDDIRVMPQILPHVNHAFHGVFTSFTHPDGFVAANIRGVGQGHRGDIASHARKNNLQFCIFPIDLYYSSCSM